MRSSHKFVAVCARLTDNWLLLLSFELSFHSWYSQLEFTTRHGQKEKEEKRERKSAKRDQLRWIGIPRTKERPPHTVLGLSSIISERLVERNTNRGKNFSRHLSFPWTTRSRERRKRHDEWHCHAHFIGQQVITWWELMRPCLLRTNDGSEKRSRIRWHQRLWIGRCGQKMKRLWTETRTDFMFNSSVSGIRCQKDSWS